MEQLPQENEAGDGRSLSDVLTGMAKDGVKQCDRRFRLLIQDRPVGAGDSPEADRVQSQPLKETLLSIARDGLDPLNGAAVRAGDPFPGGGPVFGRASARPRPRARRARPGLRLIDDLVGFEIAWTANR